MVEPGLEPTSKRRSSGAGGLPTPAEALCELAGVTLVITATLSAVTVFFSTSSPVAGWLTSPDLRRLGVGLVAVTAAATVTYSPLGMRSGGHLNPALTVGFSSLGKLRWRGAVAYIACQLAGAILGATLVLVLWRQWARGVDVGASMPGRLGLPAAFMAELALTFLLATVIFHFVDRPRVMRFTPVASATLTLLCVLFEAPASTTSLNPARTLGPDIVGHFFDAWWLYLTAPLIGAALAAVVFSLMRGKIACGKLVHSDRYVCHFRHCAYREGTIGHRGKAGEQPLDEDLGPARADVA